MDYEDDFSWRTLDPDVDPQQHQDLLVVRFLIENGYIPEHFDGAPPPASKEVVANLAERKVTIDRTKRESLEKCVICLKLDPMEPDDDDDDDDGKDSENNDNNVDNDDEQNGDDNDKNEKEANRNSCYEKVFKVMPCSHAFHSECLLPWLEKTNSCPLCRHELKTDDPNYERRRTERARAVQREQDLEILHNSMFG